MYSNVCACSKLYVVSSISSVHSAWILHCHSFTRTGTQAHRCTLYVSQLTCKKSSRIAANVNQNDGWIDAIPRGPSTVLCVVAHSRIEEPNTQRKCRNFFPFLALSLSHPPSRVDEIDDGDRAHPFSTTTSSDHPSINSYAYTFVVYSVLTMMMASVAFKFLSPLNFTHFIFAESSYNGSGPAVITKNGVACVLCAVPLPLSVGEREINLRARTRHCVCVCFMYSRECVHIHREVNAFFFVSPLLMSVCRAVCEWRRRDVNENLFDLRNICSFIWVRSGLSFCTHAHTRTR